MTAPDQIVCFAPPPRRFPAVGRCIYCAAEGAHTKLTDEHILPYFMGGKSELPSSSCTQCNKITCRIEDYCANRVMREARHHFGIQSRTKSKPDHLEMRFERYDGEIVTRRIKFSDAPHYLIIPRFEEPGILLGRSPSENVEPHGYWIWTTIDFLARMEKVRQPGDRGWQVSIPRNHGLFLRFLAKVALASVVASFGYDSRRSPLAGIVTGKNKNIRYYVGGNGALGERFTLQKAPLIEPLSTRISYGIYRHPVHPPMLGCDIAPFRQLGGPTYSVIVGEAPESNLDDLWRTAPE